MATGVGTVAGTKFLIGGTSLTPSPDTYVEVGEIANLGDLLLNFNQVAVESIGSGYSYDIKGVQKAPAIELTLNRHDGDPGQIAMKAASAAARGTLYNFKIIEVDGGIAVWRGEVFGFGTAYGSVDNLRQVKTSVSVRPDTLVITPGV